MTVNPSLGQFVVIADTYCWESVPQGSGSREDAARVELTYERLNTEGM